MRLRPAGEPYNRKTLSKLKRSVVRAQVRWVTREVGPGREGGGTGAGPRLEVCGSGAGPEGCGQGRGLAGGRGPGGAWKEGLPRAGQGG